MPIKGVTSFFQALISSFFFKKDSSRSICKIDSYIEMASNSSSSSSSSSSSLLTFSSTPSSSDRKRQLDKVPEPTAKRVKKASNKKLKKLKEQSSNVTKALGPVKKSAGALKAATDALRSETKSVLATVPDVTKEVGDAIIARIQAQVQGVEDLQRNYTRELKERKRLFNLVQELKGNIRVFCRCRPPSGRELDETQANSEGGVCVTMEGGDGSVRVVNDRGKEKDWEFNKSFDFQSTQEGVYQEVSPVVTSVLDGYNVCIFAYGQTGSGKTYTMMGPPDNRGVNTRTLEELFVKSGERSAEVEDKIQVSILEIYCEQIRDLLAENVGAQRLEIRQGDKGNYVPNLTWVPVSGRLP